MNSKALTLSEEFSDDTSVASPLADYALAHGIEDQFGYTVQV